MQQKVGRVTMLMCGVWHNRNVWQSINGQSLIQHLVILYYNGLNQVFVELMQLEAVAF